MTDVFDIHTELPLSIFPGTYKYIEIGYRPGEEGNVADRFTLNFDNQDNSERIATQLDVVAYYSEDVPSVHFTPDYDSTGASPLTTISVAFSEPVKKVFGGEIQNTDIPFLLELKETFNNGEEVPFTGEINEEKTLITLIPDQPLLENQQYFVKLLGNALIDDDENVIKLDEESYFTTGVMTDVAPMADDGFFSYPNPTDGKLLLGLPGRHFREIKIFSASGMLVHTEYTDRSRLDIDLSGQPAGIYFLRVMDEEEKIIHSGKIIKH